jgi:hypothetical protein
VELENYKVVASLSEFARLQRKRIEEWDTEYGVFKPKCFVFKPHGTISRGFTLRHLPTGVQAFEKEKLSVLTEVLKDALVVFLGFGNYNEDFWLLFGETFSRGLNDDIIIVNTRPEKVKKRLHEAQHKRQTFTYKGEIERFFEHLFNLLSNDTEFPFHTGMPSRHYIRSLLQNTA